MTPVLDLPAEAASPLLDEDFVPSHHSIGLQCADLVVAITAAAERGVGQARGYLRTLLPRFATHPMTGELEGVGLKRFPERVPRPREETKLF